MATIDEPRGGERWASASVGDRVLLVSSFSSSASSAGAGLRRPHQYESAADPYGLDTTGSDSFLQQAGAAAPRRGGLLAEPPPSYLRSSLSSSFSSAAWPPPEPDPGLRSRPAPVVHRHSETSSSSSSLPAWIAGGYDSAAQRPLNDAADGLTTQLRQVQATVEKAFEDRIRSDRVVAEFEEAAAHARDRAHAMRAYADRRRLEVERLSRQLAEDRRAFSVEETRARVEAAAELAKAEQELADAKTEAQASRQGWEARCAELTAEVAAASQREADASKDVRAGQRPQVLRARAVAAAIGDAANSVSGCGVAGAPQDPAVQWPRMLAEAAHAMAEALSLPHPSTARLPGSLRPPVSGTTTPLEQAAVTMAERFLEAAATAQSGASSEARREELEAALMRERLRLDRLQQEVEDRRLEERQLLHDLVLARQQRRKVEVEQAEFVPFAAEELEGAVERVARIRAAPAETRRLAAMAGQRLRQQRRALSMGALCRSSGQLGGAASRRCRHCRGCKDCRDYRA
eukprot:TRINITY_DN46874_c0_g1_i1.p1 TRINITY_DN46874_c0_g1~~TRINITY_DN46874_c0_g1_i1.p1  ORF type:complete len:518 (-),score=123.12 TRINITY_DN46874_c0_g1_i1:186-1739(-)